MDKKALIEHCEAVIKLHEDAAKHRVPEPVHIAELEIHRIALAALEAEPDYYVVRRVFNDKFGPEVELDAYDTELDASKSRDDHGGIIQPVYLTPPAASRVPDFEHMLKRWLSYGRACLEAGEKLPRHLVSETEALLAAPSKEDAK
jgi:hypothetical protein